MSLVQRQLDERRSTILENARQMIAECGYEKVTVRQLAERCGVSVPTLYNQFGNKDQLLATAIEDYFYRTPANHEPTGLARLLATIDAVPMRLLQDPNYHRGLLHAFASLTSTQAVQQTHRKRAHARATTRTILYAKASLPRRMGRHRLTGRPTHEHQYWCMYSMGGRITPR